MGGSKSLPDSGTRPHIAGRERFAALVRVPNRKAARAVNGKASPPAAPPAPPPASRRKRVLLKNLAQPRVALAIETSRASGRGALRGIARYVRERHAWAIFHESGDTDELVRRLAKWSGDGIIACISNRQVVDVIAAAKVPVVGVLGTALRTGFALIDLDHTAVAKLAAGHLRQCDCQAFGFVGVGGANGSEKRCAAFAAEVGMNATFHVFHSEMSVLCDSRRNELARWLKRLPKPVGIMAADDHCGRYVLAAARRARLSIPDEVAVIGVDDDEPICELADPPLSSIRPDYPQVGYRAAELLDRLMKGARAPTQPIIVPTADTVVRQSTQLAAAVDPDIARAVRFIRQHACHGIRVEQVAEEVQLSRSTLKRRFRAAMKRSVHDEILRVRLGWAQELLAQTDLPLDTVAQRAGFRHQEYMGAVFRAKLGRTPAELRRQRT
jgi:LacI family transcriptional regulator